MTFLSPIFLWLLPLVSIPILIHLLAKQKSRLIDFPSLKFLKLLEHDALRKFNIKQLILLIIRTLMILLTILAFSRPNIKLVNGWNISTRAVDLIIIAMDNTASNRAAFGDETEPWIKQLQSSLEEKGVKVYFCGLADLELFDDPEKIIPSYSNVYPEDFETKISDQIDLHQYRHRSIIWIGDGQDADLKLTPLDEWDKYVLLNKVERDLGIMSTEHPNRLLRKGDTYTLGVNLGYLSDDPVVSLELLMNDRRVNQSAISRDDHYIEISTRVEDPGFQEGKLSITQDGHNYNNSRYFVLEAGGSIPVQILYTIQSPDYWRLIESSIKKAEMNLDISRLTHDRIDDLNLSRGGTIIIDDASTLADYTWNRLQTFISLGGQVILFGDGGAKMRALLNFSAAPIEEQSQYPHGLSTSGVSNGKLNSIPMKKVIEQDRLKIFQRFNIAGDELEETWIRYLDGQPFLGARNIQNGRIVWFNTFFRPEASNLPLLGVFPTLINQISQFQFSKNTMDPFNALVGDSLAFFPTVQENGNPLFSIQRPDGTIDYQAPDSNYVVHYYQTDHPGIYRFLSGRKVLQSVAVNISSYEAQAHHSGDVSIEGFDVYENHEILKNEILDMRNGIALWPILLILLFLLWIIETYLARIKSTWRQND